LLAGRAAYTGEVLLVRFIMAVLILLPTTTPAGLIAAKIKSIFRRARK
jgi:hypothetical protein